MGLNFEHLWLSAEGYKLTKQSCVVFQLLFASKLQIYGESAYINNCEMNKSIYGEASVEYFHVLIQRATVQRRLKKNENKRIYFLKMKMWSLKISWKLLFNRGHSYNGRLQCYYQISFQSCITWVHLEVQNQFTSVSVTWH